MAGQNAIPMRGLPPIDLNYFKNKYTMIKKIIGLALLATAAGAYFLSKKKEEQPSVSNNNDTARDNYLKQMAQAGAVIYYFETLVERDGIPRGGRFYGIMVPDNAYGSKTYFTGDGKFVAYTIDELKNLGSSKVVTTSNNNSTNTANTTQSGSSVSTNAGAGSSFGMSGVAQLMN